MFLTTESNSWNWLCSSGQT